jgi:hypothetical protein
MAVLSSDQNKNKNFLIEAIIHKWFNNSDFSSIWAFLLLLLLCMSNKFPLIWGSHWQWQLGWSWRSHARMP